MYTGCMNLLTSLTFALCIPLTVSAPKLEDYKLLTQLPTRRDAVRTQTDFLCQVYTDSLVLEDFRKAIRILPAGTTLTREQILSMIEDCTKRTSQEVERSRIEKYLLENMKNALELESLRKKSKGSASSSRPGGSLGGG